MSEDKETPQPQDLTPDLIEAAAYQRWIRDRIPPESPYPWYQPEKRLETLKEGSDRRAAL